MSSTYGQMIKLSIFGQSHGPAIGMTLDGVPAGLPVDEARLAQFLTRRAPGRSAMSTTRKEPDRAEFLSGIVDGHTCGAPISAIIRNTNTRSGDYGELLDCPRPGHADYTAQVKYGGAQDAAGGGHFSGRLTAPLCIAGGLCKQWLDALGIDITAHIYALAGIRDLPFSPTDPQISQVGVDFPVLSPESEIMMRRAVEDAKMQADSVGGIVECAVTGLPVGLGEPMFGGMEGRIAQIVYGIPAVKGVEFGAGFHAAELRGSENNDPYEVSSQGIRTSTNHSGGILGGITNGMPLILRAAFKPTPSISRPQQSVSLSNGTQQSLVVKGRHDPCIVPRAVPVVEAAVAVAVYDALLEWNARKPIGGM